jgi:hypothetical protein
MKKKFFLISTLVIAMFFSVSLLSPKQSKSEGNKVGHFVINYSVPCPLPQSGRIYYYKCEGLGSTCSPGETMTINLCNNS